MGSRHTDKHTSHTPPHIIEDNEASLNDNDIDILLQPVYKCTCNPKYKASCRCPGSQETKQITTETSSLMSTPNLKDENRKQIAELVDDDETDNAHMSITVSEDHTTPSQSFCHLLRKRICLLVTCVFVFIFAMAVVYVS
jgi:hypothetical protein